MINSIGVTNPIQRLNAMNAFKAAGAIQQTPAQMPDVSDGIDIQEDILKNQNVSEIQNIAKIAGEDVSEDDIRYGVTYGRSVIAEYIA